MTQRRLSWDKMLCVPPAQLSEYAHVKVRILPDAPALFDYLARFTADLIQASQDSPVPLRVIWPCGPKRHFPILTDICNRERISWRNTFVIQMDEWLDWKCRALPASHPFNLQSYLRRELLGRLDPELRPAEDHLLFHDPLHLDHVDRKLDELGGADVVFGGFGFTGHFAFNEPPISRWQYVSNEDFCSSRTRILPINDETFIMHSQRSTGGNTRIIPPMAVTLGMRDLLAARMIRLASDGGAWKQTIFRILCMHEPTVAYPCTFVQDHPDVEVIVDAHTAECPPYGFNN